MRIAELAELAGVSVRTLRYYHQVGALPEPPRLSNGYRDYSVDDLVRVLRIHQLTSSGLPLATAGELAAGPAPHAAEEVLEEADKVLESQIAVLTERRARLAEARAGGHVGLSWEARALSIETTDLPPAILLAHLYRGHPQFSRLADALLQPDRRARATALQRRFEQVDEHTPEAELDEIVDQVQALLAEVDAELPPLREEWTRLVLELVERDLNPRQRELLGRQG
ncbi:MAG TPA: MerR family transcriptional regulator [Candidatus Brachybacterium merdigallinarum]|nr:MerR family transcriptional regulator [Candidatus Brachybacterium merdigallinarum]